jgi:hypothetical protein
MGQHASNPLERPPTSISVYESAPEYSEPSFKASNVPDFGWTPPGVIRTLYEFSPDPDRSTSPESTPATPKYQYSEELMQEAKQQYTTCRGLFWELALLKLRDHFLHPVDLTEAEFVEFVSVSDIDAWLDMHRPKLIYRVICRRATAQQALKDAGISPLELGGIEMFELMNDAERANFIEEYKSRQQDLAAELYNAANEEIVSGSTTPVDLEELEEIRELKEFYKRGDFETLDDLEMLDGSEPSTILETPVSIWSTKEQRQSPESQHQPPAPLKRRTILGSLGAAFRSYRPRESSGSSGTTAPAPKTGTTRKSINFSRRLGKSVRSIRLVLGQKRRAFKRAAIGGDLYVKSHSG